MINEEIITLFRNKGPKTWNSELSSDCRVVNADKKDFRADEENAIEYKKHFSEIEDDEVILFTRDTSFWNNSDQGCVITDKKIHVILDNSDEDSCFCFNWTDVTSVKICKGQFCFYFGKDDDEPLCLEPKILLKKNTSDFACQKRIADFLNEVANIAIHPAKEALERIDDESTPEDEKIAIAKNMIGQYPEYDCAFEYFLGFKAFEKGNNEEAIQLLNHALKNENISDSGRCRANLIIGEIGLKRDFNCESDTKNRFWDALRIEDSNSEMFDENTTVYEHALASLKRYDENFIANLDRIPSHLKKVLVPVKSYGTIEKEYDLPQSLISLAALHASDISFPFGHPIAGHVYVAHPAIPKRYIPIDNNELDITEDKIREFCYFVQCMGATKITITSSYSNANNSTVSNASSKGVNGSTVGFDIGVENNNRTDNRIGEWLRSLMHFNQEFNPTTKPYIPDDLVWFEQEPSWKRLAKQRMNGSLIKHHEHLDVKKSRIIQNNEINELLGSFKKSFIEAEGYLKQYKRTTEKFAENILLDIEVSFWPVDTNGELVSLEIIENSRPINQLMSNYTNPV